jgi:hypothetical protein
MSTPTHSPRTPRALTGDGEEILPGVAVVPILKEIAAGHLKVAGTGFFVTRYGLLATARHVIEDLVDQKTQQLSRAFVFQQVAEDGTLLRRIQRATISPTADVGLIQLQLQDPPQSNFVATLSFDDPEIGEELKTFAYPENVPLDFRDTKATPLLKADYYTGRFLEHIASDSNPFLRNPHFSTSIEIYSGASGCPVFDSRGACIGIASRGWDFRGGEQAANPLSSVLSTRLLLPAAAPKVDLPPSTWEFLQIPPERRGQRLTFGEVVAYGHTGKRGRLPTPKSASPTDISGRL